MRRYKTIFYKSEWNKDKNSWTQHDLKIFYVYAFSYDQADKIARQKLVEYQDFMRDQKIAYWMDAIGDRKVYLPFGNEEYEGGR